MPSSLRTLIDSLFAPVDAASLVIFRAAFGVLMMIQVGDYLFTDNLPYYLIQPTYSFPYPAFAWIKPLGQWEYLHFALMFVAAIGIALGLFYRLSSVIFFLGWTYFFLSDKAFFQNHYYFICLLSFMLIFLPLNVTLSLDAVLRRITPSQTVPAWALWWLRFQIGVPYFFGGIAKINEDWLLRAQPMTMWLADRSDFAIVGAWFEHPLAGRLFSYGGLLLDLLAVPALLWRRTRPFALVAAIAFHVMNNSLFPIGIFPPMMIAATTVFLEPHWPRDVLRWLVSQLPPHTEQHGHYEANPAAPSAAPRFGTLLVALLAVWALIQIAVPLRHILISGHPSWTEEGHEFAWHMRLRDKDSEVWFTVFDPATGTTWQVDPREYLTGLQYDRMAARPHMIYSFAQYLGSEYQRMGVESPEVYVWAQASLNGRPPALMIDPTANLMQERYRWGGNWWITRTPEDMPLP